MSLNPEGVIKNAKKDLLILNLIEKHKLGRLSAQKILKTSPDFIVVENIDKKYKKGRNGILLINVQFNSEIGAFKGNYAYKEFFDKEQVNYNVMIHEWIKERVKINFKIKLPEIYIIEDNYIIYEGVEGTVYEESPIKLLEKAKLTGEILATYHSAETHPADIKRYTTLLTKTVNELPLTNKRKDKLLSLGYTLLSNYNLENSGIYGYGDFQPDNVIINPNGSCGYLIDPEFVETDRNADRMEDIANFFVFSAISEFKKKNSVNETFLALRSFLRSYNNYLKLSGTSLETIYKGKNILGLICYHLGLIAFIQSTSISRRIKKDDQYLKQIEIDELMLLYNFTKFLWTKGLEYLPEKVFIKENKKAPTKKEGWAESWVAMGKALFDNLQKDYYFQLIYNKPKETGKIEIEKALQHWGLINQKELEEMIKILNSWFKETVITIKNDEIKYEEEQIKKLDLTKNLGNWKEISQQLKKIYLKKPENKIIDEIAKNNMIGEKELEQRVESNKKEIQEIVKKLIKQKILINLNKTLTLHPAWAKKIGIPEILATEI